jgi:hypothetical protein
LIEFQWGYCPTRFPESEHIYDIGEEIYWRACPDGSVPAWVYFKDGPRESPGNIGEPTVRDVIVRDASEGYSFVTSCTGCGQPFAGAAVEIRDGRIERAWLCKPGQSEGGRYTVDDGFLLLPGEFSEAEYEQVVKGLHRTGEVTNDPDLHASLDMLYRRPDYYHIMPDGLLAPMLEWNDHRMGSINADCQEVPPW